MELLIPNGPVLAEKGTSYATVASLARVNKETAQHLDGLFYRNAKTACNVHMTGHAVRAMRQIYGNHLGQPFLNEHINRPSMMELHRSGLNQFTHYKLDIRDDSGWSSALFIMLQHVFEAIGTPHTTTSTTLNRKPNIDLTIRMVTYVDPGVHRSYGLPRVAKRMQQVLCLIKQYEMEGDWTVVVKIMDHPNEFHVIATKSKLDFKGDKGSISKKDMNNLHWLVESLRFTDWVSPAVHEHQKKSYRWSSWLKLTGMMRDLLLVKYVTIKSCEHTADLITNFQEGFGMKDTECLKALCQVIRGLWEGFLDHRQLQVDQLRDRLLKSSYGMHDNNDLVHVLSKVPQATSFAKVLETCGDTVKRLNLPWERILRNSVSYKVIEEYRSSPHVAVGPFYGMFSRASMDGNVKPQFLIKRLRAYHRCAKAAAEVRHGQQLLPWISQSKYEDPSKTKGSQLVTHEARAARNRLYTDDEDNAAGTTSDPDIRKYF